MAVNMFFSVSTLFFHAVTLLMLVSLIYVPKVSEGDASVPARVWADRDGDNE